MKHSGPRMCLLYAYRGYFQGAVRRIRPAAPPIPPAGARIALRVPHGSFPLYCIRCSTSLAADFSESSLLIKRFSAMCAAQKYAQSGKRCRLHPSVRRSRNMQAKRQVPANANFRCDDPTFRTPPTLPPIVHQASRGPRPALTPGRPGTENAPMQLLYTYFLRAHRFSQEWHSRRLGHGLLRRRSALGDVCLECSRATTAAAVRGIIGRDVPGLG
ncbi:hypothetical protein C8Q77DRAFT_155547 [Trametes polyzona]|nr:hypothetical protein C8Q77DRAFT_155547 [Trametes polyzona]